MVLTTSMLLMRVPTAVLRRSALQSAVPMNGSRLWMQTQGFRALSSQTTPPVVDAALKEEKKTTQSKKEEPLTNEKLWDRVLSDHPEHDDRKNSDLLYEYPRKGYFGILSAGSLAHIAFWSWFKGYEESLAEMLPAMGEPTMFSFITNDFGSSLGFGSSILLAFLIGFHARRAVARISVVAGGEKLRFTTHKFFGDLGQPFDVPVGNVSAHPNTKKNIILKVGKDRGFYLVDVHGQFYNRKKLESMITFRTDFSEHEKMIKTKENARFIEVRTDLPRTELKSDAAETPKASPLPKRVSYHAKGKGNLLGRKPTTARGKPKGKK
ncbi:hypothetical protein Poli38472_000833 [Pythium oligandrum]|uniref:Uncharacterized protein n=1 Tax=Pythium oligandrum TaxID=41045 RepID=A0A8K1CD99_PYTOL|nr:hypothetical protein Poli38472_000833 [Pythium oligandrum]|eukprot:TMW60791.1 hypothetical protein Poli38472_000833 [Pythium oligandrum]